MIVHLKALTGVQRLFKSRIAYLLKVGQVGQRHGLIKKIIKNVHAMWTDDRW